MRFLEVVFALEIKEFEQRVPSSHLEKDERLILGYICIYSWKRHALCYAVLGYARTRWLNTLYGIVWDTKYGRFTTLTIPKYEHFTRLVCPLRFLVISAMRELLSFLQWTRARVGVLPHLETFTWQIVTPAERFTLPGRPGNPPRWVTPPVM